MKHPEPAHRAHPAPVAVAGEPARARCTCPRRDMLCPRCLPVTYSRLGAKHRKDTGHHRPVFTYQTTNVQPVTR